MALDRHMAQDSALSLEQEALWLSGTALRREPHSRMAGLEPAELLECFRAADPTRNGSCLPWLLRTYGNGGFLLEDLEQARQTLATFARLRQWLPDTCRVDGEARNPRKLGSHASLASVCAAISPLVARERAEAEQALLAEPAGRELRRQERAEALSESVVVHRSERMTVALPMTQKASSWWGRGTQWCTAADNYSVFTHYYEKAPLLVILLAAEEGRPARKLQLHACATRFQFMDENDMPVAPSLVEESWSRMSGIVLWAFDQNGAALQYIPECLQTQAMRHAAVVRNGLALHCIPQHLRSEAACLAAVGQDAWALEHVPEIMQTQEMCSAAVAQNGWALRFVSATLQTEALQWAAVLQNGHCLSLLPEPLKTREMCSAAVASHGLALQFVPRDMQTDEMCIKAVQEEGRSLFYVPSELQTDEVFLAAVRQNGAALMFVPRQMRTESICLAAVERRASALCHVPEQMRTTSVRLAAAAGKQDPKRPPLDPSHSCTPVWDLAAVISSLQPYLAASVA